MLSRSWRASIADSTGGLAGPDDIFGTAHGGGRIHGQDLADYKPVEQHADGSQPLFDRRRRKPASEVPDPSGDVHGFYVKQPKAGLVAPVEEFACGPVIGFAGVRVADVRGEEFDERRPACWPRAAITGGTAALVVVRSMAGGLSRSAFKCEPPLRSNSTEGGASPLASLG
jgi:hypothetical protein